MEPRPAKKRITTMRIYRHTWILLLLLLALPTFPAAAQPDPGLRMTARAGYDGLYKPNLWTPVQVQVANSGPAISGELRITLGSLAVGDQVVFNTPIDLPTQSDKLVTLYIHLPRFTGEIEVDLIDNNGRTRFTATSNKLTQLAPDAILYGVVTATPGSLDLLQDVTGSRSEAGVAYLELSQLPDLPAAWHALDALILADTDTSQLTPTQQQILAGWVEMGGQLVVGGGAGWQKTAVPLADILPVTLIGSEVVDDLPALSAATGQPFRDPGPYLITTSSLRRGELLFHQDGLPILARQQQGQGGVYFLALDPNLAPLVDWAGSPLLWTAVADRLPARSPWANGVQNNWSARDAVSSLPDLTLPSVLQLMLFLLVYVVVVGPINYTILKRRRRRELAWITIPAIVLLFSLIAYVTGFQIKGNNTILNEMSTAYGASNSSAMRVQSLLGLYSPRRSSYNLSLPLEVMARPLTTGIGSGGSQEAITRSNDVTLHNIRVDVSGVETFLVDSVQPAPPITAEASLSLRDEEVMLTAVVLNESDLLLENAVLLLGASAFPLGDLAPGATANLAKAIGTAGAAATATGSPLLGLGVASGSPLLSNATTILGVNDYYNDREAYPRFQLLQALEPEFSSGLIPVTPVATLLAWSQQSQVEATLGGPAFDHLATTLYFWEIPLIQEMDSGSVSVPPTLLNWEIVADNGLYAPAIQNFYLPPSVWVEVAYQPWPELQALVVTDLAVRLQGDLTSGQPPPAVKLWDWAQEEWVLLRGASWGETAVADPQPFIGPDNSLRLRLENNSPDGLTIGEIYPLLTGDLRLGP